MLGWNICLIAACGTFYTAGETPRAPRGHRACCKLLVSVKDVLIEEAPMRAPPAECNSALRRDQAPLLGWAYLPRGRALRVHFLYGGRSWGRDRIGRRVDVL